MLIRLLRESREPGTQCWGEMSTTLTSLADGADLLLTGMSYRGARCQRRRVSRHSVGHAASGSRYGSTATSFRSLPAPLIRSAMTVYEWLVWRGVKKVEDAQRRELGLPKANRPLRRDGSQNADRWKSRPTTRCAFPGWQPNGRNGTASGPLSAR